MKKDRLLGLFSLITAVIGSVLMASNIGLNTVAYGFFLTSSLAAAFLLMKSDADRSLVWTQFFFIISNIVGLIRYL